MSAVTIPAADVASLLSGLGFDPGRLAGTYEDLDLVVDRFDTWQDSKISSDMPVMLCGGLPVALCGCYEALETDNIAA